MILLVTLLLQELTPEAASQLLTHVVAKSRQGQLDHLLLGVLASLLSQHAAKWSCCWSGQQISELLADHVRIVFSEADGLLVHSGVGGV